MLRVRPTSWQSLAEQQEVAVMVSCVSVCHVTVEECWPTLVCSIHHSSVSSAVWLLLPLLTAARSCCCAVWTNISTLVDHGPGVWWDQAALSYRPSKAAVATCMADISSNGARLC